MSIDCYQTNDPKDRPCAVCERDTDSERVLWVCASSRGRDARIVCRDCVVALANALMWDV